MSLCWYFLYRCWLALCLRVADYLMNEPELFQRRRPDNTERITRRGKAKAAVEIVEHIRLAETGRGSRMLEKNRHCRRRGRA